MSDLVLYTNPMSRGRIARWMLEETGRSYDTRILGYGEEMKSAEYLAINPLGKVPAITHGDKVITEAAAICAYLADAFPEAGLAPVLTDRADYYRWLFFVSGPLEACLVGRALGFEVPEEKSRMAGYGRYGDMLGALEGALASREYIAGNTFTAADVYVGAQVSWGLQFGTIEPRPVFTAYAERLASRPAFKRANELDDAVMPKEG